MSHVRKQLRDAVIAALNSGVAALNNRAEGVRGFMRNLDRLPAAEISTPGEQTEGETMDGLLARNIELVVTLYVAGDSVEDQCDALAVQAEKAIYGDATVMGMVSELTPESMSFEMQGEGEKRIARMEMSWAAVVRTFENDPETAI
ncbi:hypothetical protein [Citreimonas sp.]|uniref:hypothetical protein n=1 Tax=Citreimonas sp. TaxID=3036715 RepID=UPI004058B771